ncbi:MAG: hypothetical protein FWG65_04395 [Turicibacter sp.]|nr:hypothetical protein [Turicibacter sp.]
MSNIDTRNSKDKVLKESLSLYKGGTLDFLDVALKGKILAVLNTEVTEENSMILEGNLAIKVFE